jgi:hypothetical protein
MIPVSKNQIQTIWWRPLETKKFPVEYIVFEDDGHGFSKKENKQMAYQGISQFLEKIVGGDKFTFDLGTKLGGKME